ncbi:MAG: hypothetical protein PHP64_01065 [Actinomycetota bacterium]|nr:hypothetical protein [Actinomycetota bacterium]
MNRCEKHPDEDSMVTCMSCGRNFCRICHPLLGAGQYCPRCHEEYIEKLGKGAEAIPVEQKGKSKSLLKSLVEKIKRFFSAVPNAILSALRKCAKFFVFIAHLPVRIFRRVASEIKEHFPFSLAERKDLSDISVFQKIWWKLVISLFSGLILWVIVVMIFHQRNPAFSLVVSAIVAFFVSFFFGWEFGVPVGILSCLVVLGALSLGEVVAQVLCRAKILRLNDVQTIGIVQLGSKETFGFSFVIKVILQRLLPSAALAFLIGYWPLPKRPAWRGWHGVRSCNTTKS